MPTDRDLQKKGSDLKKAMKMSDESREIVQKTEPVEVRTDVAPGEQRALKAIKKREREQDRKNDPFEQETQRQRKEVYDSLPDQAPQPTLEEQIAAQQQRLQDAGRARQASHQAIVGAHSARVVDEQNQQPSQGGPEQKR